MPLYRKLKVKNEPMTITKDELLSINVCPNCWGRQEYQDQFHEEYGAKLSMSKYKTSLQKFVEARVTGIKLTKEEGRLMCQSCNEGFDVT